jgi:drug/metabolite transporter (DMT)-like permease
MQRDQILPGIFYMIASTIMFSAVNALVKWEVAIYPVDEVAFFRSAFSIIPCLLIVLPRRGLAAVIRTERFGAHLKRALSQLCSMTAIFMAFKLMPLAGAMAISFSAPLITTVLSVFILKEKVGIHRWSAIGIGLIGVIVITDPGAGTFQLGAVFALANAVLISSVAVAIRRMGQTESAETLLFYQITLLTVLTGLFLPFGFILPTLFDGALLTLAGLANGVAQYWWTKSLHIAPPSAVVPFNYLSLLWATIIGFAIWGDLPTLHLILGSGVLVATGLYILWRESGERRLLQRARSS